MTPLALVNFKGAAGQDATSSNGDHLFTSVFFFVFLLVSVKFQQGNRVCNS